MKYKTPQIALWRVAGSATPVYFDAGGFWQFLSMSRDTIGAQIVIETVMFVTEAP
jgi:hypothetical protein